jgi:GAF domain
MAIRPATDLERLIDGLEKRGVSLDSKVMAAVSQEIAKLFGVAPDEVAVLELVPPGKFLRFVLPEKLQSVGTIPLTSTTALAARTARDHRADIVNNFATARHASVFEGVPLGTEKGGPIQKIMSAPILRGDQTIGVVQISRKGHSPGESGPDFSPKDLSELQGINTLLGRMLALTRAR